MGLRDIVLALVCYGALPIIPFRPFLGLLMFSWLAYMRPQDLSWVLRSATLSQYVAVATLAGLGLGFVLPRVVPRERLATLRLQTFWLIALLGLGVHLLPDRGRTSNRRKDSWASFSNASSSPSHDRAWCARRQRFRLMIMVIGMSLGALGLKYALFGALRGGSVFTGGPGGFMVDNNSFALCLNMALPCWPGSPWSKRRKRSGSSALVLAVGSSLTIVFTLSRGGLLTLAMVALLLVWTSGKRVLVCGLSFGLRCGLFSLRERRFSAAVLRPHEHDQELRCKTTRPRGRIEEWGTAKQDCEGLPGIRRRPREPEGSLR